MWSSFDISEPDAPLFPSGVKSVSVNNFVILILYNPDVYGPKPLTVDALLATSGHAQWLTHKAGFFNQFVMQLWLFMAQERYMIIQGCCSTFEITCDPASVLVYKGTLSQPVQYQGEMEKLEGDTAHIHQTGPLRHFIDLSSKLNIYGNLLNASETHVKFPLFIPWAFLLGVSLCSMLNDYPPSPLASCTKALKLTHTINNVKLPMCRDILPACNFPNSWLLWAIWTPRISLKILTLD